VADHPGSRAPLLLGLCLCLILAVAAALAPWLYHASKGLLAHVDAAVWPWNELARADFARVFNRSVLLAALIVLPLFGRHLGMSRKLLPPLRPKLPHFALGFLLAAGLLLALGAVYVQQGIYKMREPAPWGAVGAPLTAAFGAGILEELLFRGLILGMMLQALRQRTALVACTFLFAIVHFLTPPEGLVIQEADIHAGTGFWLVGIILGHFTHLDFFLAEFCTLFAVGWALVRARMVTGGLWLSIGLHAGWVFGLKWFSALTRTSKDLKEGDFLPWVGLNLKAGLLSLIVVVFTGWLAVKLAKSGTGDKAKVD
jgi:uncharacterized protein